MIVSVHIRDYLIFKIPSELAGYLTLFGVGLFVFISGYVLRESSPEIRDGGELKKFLWKRFIRLYPLYWLSLGLFVILLPWHPDASSSSLPVFSLGMQEALAPEYLQPTSYLWFVGLISVLSLIYPFLVWRQRQEWRILGASLVIFLFLVVLRLLFGIIEYRMFLFFFLFVAGVLLSRSNPFLMGKRRFLKPTALIFAAVLPSYLLWFTVPGIQSWGEAITLFLKASMALGFCLATLLLAIVTGKYLTVRMRGLIQFCSHASFCVFLFHVLIFYWVSEQLAAAQVGGAFHDLALVLAVPIVFLSASLIQSLEGHGRSKLASFSIGSRKQESRLLTEKGRGTA